MNFSDVVWESRNCPQLPSSVKQFGLNVKVPYKTLIHLLSYCPCDCLIPMLAVHWPSQENRGTYQGGASLPCSGRLRLSGTTIFLQYCKDIAQAWRSPSVIGAIMRVKLLRATLCSSSTATLVKGCKFPQQSGCTMVCGSIMKSRTMPSGLRKLSLSGMFSQGSRSKNQFLKLSP